MDGKTNVAFDAESNEIHLRKSLSHRNEFETADKVTKRGDEAQTTNCIGKIQNFLTEFSEDYQNQIKWTCIVLFSVLFLIYLIYALWYDFHRALPLLVITLIVLCSIAFSKIFLPFVWRPHLEKPANRQLSHVQRVWDSYRFLRWGVYGMFILAVFLYVAIDIFAISLDSTGKPDYRRLISFLGLLAYVGLIFLMSTNPAKVNWRPVLWGIALQLIFALLILKFVYGAMALNWFSTIVSTFLGYTEAGSSFVYGFLVKVPPICEFRYAPVLAFQVFPTVIFFSSFVSILYYYGIMQLCVKKMAGLMQVTTFCF